MRRVPIVVVLVAAVLACSDQHASRDVRSPTVVSRTPAAGDAQAFGGHGIVAVFSEPLDPATVNEETVLVRRGGQLIPATVELLGDGATIRVTPDRDVEGDLAIELTTGLADRAGNAFAGDATPWTFQLPGWVRIGDPISNVRGAFPVVSLAVVGADVPCVGTHGRLDGRVAACLEGGAWKALPPPPSELVKGGRVVRGAEGELWLMGGNEAGDAFALRWEPGWRGVGSPPSVGVVVDVRRVARAQGAYLVTEEVRRVDGAPTSWLVAWSGDGIAGWNLVGEWPKTNGVIDVATGPNGEVYAAWASEAGVSVVEVAPGGAALPIIEAPGGSAASVAVGPDGLPRAVARTAEGIVVMSYDRASGWTQVGEPVARTSSWGPATDLAIDVAGAPVVAWAAPDEGATEPWVSSVHVARWDGAGWERHGPLNADVTRDVPGVALALDWADEPVVAWAEYEARVEKMDTYLYRAARRNYFARTDVSLPVETWASGMP